MPPTPKERLYRFLRWTERYTKTDMVYFAQGTFWLYVNFLAVNVLALGLSVAFARLLTKDVYGSYQYLLTIGSILGAFTLSGMNSALTRAVAQGHEGTIRASIPVQLKYNAAASVLALAIALYYFTQGNLTVAAGVLALGLFIPLVNTFNSHWSLFNGRKNFRMAFVFISVPAVIYTAVMFAALFFVKNPTLLIIANFGVNALAAVGFFLFAMHRYRPNADVDSDALSYGKHLSFANIIASIAGQIDNLLVFHFLGAVDLAVYAFASTVPEKISSLLKGVSTLALPKFANRTTRELQDTMLAKSMRYALLFLIAVLVYVAIAPTLFALLFPQYGASVAYSDGYAFALLFSTLPSVPLTALTALGAQRQIYQFNTVGSFISIGFMVALVIPFGIWGLIIARGGAGFVNYVLILVLLNRVPATRNETNLS